GGGGHDGDYLIKVRDDPGGCSCLSTPRVYRGASGGSGAMGSPRQQACRRNIPRPPNRFKNRCLTAVPSAEKLMAPEASPSDMYSRTKLRQDIMSTQAVFNRLKHTKRGLPAVLQDASRNDPKTINE